MEDLIKLNGVFSYVCSAAASLGTELGGVVQTLPRISWIMSKGNEWNDATGANEFLIQ